jgi:SAM-dependent methyltransferase
MNKKEWFIDWFNSYYYHLLYNNRDDKEARAFIIRLTKHINLNFDTHVLDLGCGKGRHSFELKKHYNQVTGLDLSHNSIKEAKKNNLKGLFFTQQDMRFFKLDSKFDAVFNLFTSFGYFENTEDNLNVLTNCHKHLNKNGLLLIDFFNANKVSANLIKKETKRIEEITFNIKREITNNKIIKTIAFNDIGKEYYFQEKVQLLTLENFKNLLIKANFKLIKSFGSYQLTEFNSTHSDRLILLAEKQ